MTVKKIDKLKVLQQLTSSAPNKNEGWGKGHRVFAARLRVLVRLVSLAQIAELACRLSKG